MKKNKNAIITIEILISLVIIFLAIIVTTSSIKTTTILNKKESFYIDEYITVNSILNHLESIQTFEKEITSDYNLLNLYENDYLNGFIVKIHIKLEKKLNNYYQTLYKEGNIGENIFYLYKISLDLKKDNYNKNYQFYIQKSDFVKKGNILE